MKTLTVTGCCIIATALGHHYHGMLMAIPVAVLGLNVLLFTFCNEYPRERGYDDSVG